MPKKQSIALIAVRRWKVRNKEMSDVELIVRIPEEVYKSICKMENPICRTTLMVAIANGTPLPKGHGRLKDTDKIINDGRSKGFCDWYDEMKYADTIIEADKEREV